MAPVTRQRIASKPTACQSTRKNVMVELSSRHNRVCMLCGHKEISEKLYGLLYQLDNVVVHYFCILLSSKAVQNGADNEGIWGFLLKDIKAELARGTKEICSYCNKKGATISCCGSKCRKKFHLPCGLKNGSMHQYFQAFKSFCQKHRVLQAVDLSELNKSTSTQCAICKDAVTLSPIHTSIWAPCCRHDAWFHRECVQDLALNAGYFFKCPLCNDVDKFKSRMLTLGIYIPSRDASWETVPNAYAELSESHSTCSIETCLCPHEKKRQFQLPSGSWEIILCDSCGSNGTHKLCGSIKREQVWRCAVCIGVTDKDAVKKKTDRFELHDSGTSGMSSGTSSSTYSGMSSGMSSGTSSGMSSGTSSGTSSGMSSGMSCNGEVSPGQHTVIVYHGNQSQSSDDAIVISDSEDSNQCISDVEPPNTHAIKQENTHAVEQPNTYDVEQPIIYDVEQPIIYDVEQPIIYDVEQPIIYDVEQPNIYDVEQPNIYDVEQPNIYDVEQPNIYDVEQPIIYDVEQPNIYDVEQPNIYDVEQPNIYDVEQPNTHFIGQPNTPMQVQQAPLIQLPRISSYGSITTGFIRNLFRNGFPLFGNHLTTMSIDLTSDGEDD